MKAIAEVDKFIAKFPKWSDGLSTIRTILNNTELLEEIKWGMPTYTLKGKNVVSFCGFKYHFGVWFHQGAFLSDPRAILENAQEGKTKGMRHIKYLDSEDVDIDILQSYVLEAIQNQKDGKEIKIERKKTKDPIPELMKEALSNEAIQILENFPPGKRNEYIEYINSAKRASTKMNRLDKIEPLIIEGKGLNDKYKK